MARTRTRRPRAARRGASFPDIMTVGRYLVRPEVVGTALVVLVAAAIPYVLPLTGVIGQARDLLVRIMGLHVFTAMGLLAGLGFLLAMRRADALKRHARHVAGLLVLLAFIAGALGRWYPNTQVGDVDLLVTSAGGDAGRAFAATGWSAAIWLLLLPAGFALLWPRTAVRLAQATPPALWASLRAIGAGARWVWRLGLHRMLWRGVASTPRLLRALNRRLDVARPTAPVAEPQAAAPRRRREEALEEAVDEVSASVAEPPVMLAPVADEDAPAKPPTQLPMDLETPVKEWRQSADGWQLPPVKMLKKVEVAARSALDNQRRAELIEETLASFGVDSTVVEVNEGPAVTQFGVEPGWDIKTRIVVERDANGRPILDADGNPRQNEVEVSRTRIRVNRITALQNDLALALAAPALRVEAPVPGKAMIGIEVPNGTTSIVTLRQIVESPTYQKFAPKAALPLALGAGVSGEAVVADLAKMPHLLIAGATGAGKSVCLNSIITALLMNYSPEQLRFVLIDPKRVELTSFAPIPHLAFSEIVVEMDRVVGTLQAVINEMETRYRRFAQSGVRNIERYNEKDGVRKLPYWAVVIDELADLMLVAPYQVEHQLVRLAQLARATGIHLIVATQRPSVDVITGLIKANFPTRIAFAVSSQVDSRTILDMGGAEKLIGKGDMLYMAPDAQKPKRVQGVYVTDEEIEAVVKFWTADRFKRLAPEKYDEALDRALEEAATLGPDGTPGEAPGDDPMLQRAMDVAKEARTLSTSMLQRKLGIGYPRAARLMDLLERRGIVGAQEPGGKPREVLVNAHGEPAGGVDARQPASLAAHAAAFTPTAPQPEVAAARPAFPSAFDSE